MKKFWAWLKKDKRRLLVAAILLIALCYMLYAISKKNTSKTIYQTSTVQKGTIVFTVSASGKVLTTNILSISTQASGVVKKVYVKDGDKVYAGQKLAEITLDTNGQLANTKAWVSLTSATNSYRSSQASLNNTYDQIKGHANDESFSMIETRTRAEVGNDNAWANLVSTRLLYQQTSPIITAPFSGIIGGVNLVEGMVLESSNSTTSINSQRVATIKANTLPVVSVSLSEIDVPKVKVGQKVTITIDSLTGKTFTGTVATVDRVGTTSSNVTSYTANIKLDSESNEILPNMAATANIIIETVTDTLYLPTTALTTQNDVTYAKVLKNGSENLVEVTTGISSDTNTQIKSGITEGEIVITGTNTTSSSTSSSTSTRSVFSGGFGAGGNVRIAR